MLGTGVMINEIFGDENRVKIGQAVGRKISSVEIVDNELVFKFDDESDLVIYDGGQSCCEQRWMHSDDNLGYYSGAVLMDMSVRDGGEVPAEDNAGGWDDTTESQFLVVDTDKGSFTVANYNSHNGYYGGFYITAK
jgi:hypothetical protein